LLLRVLDLERQKILTKDNITVDIDTCVYYRIVNPKMAFYKIADIVISVAEVTYATLRTICGENNLQDLLEKRQEIADLIEDYVFQKTDKWGTLPSTQASTLSRSSSRT
jgi:erythrocyte band 7 integral membrane protein